MLCDSMTTLLVPLFRVYCSTPTPSPPPPSLSLSLSLFVLVSACWLPASRRSAILRRDRRLKQDINQAHGRPPTPLCNKPGAGKCDKKEEKRHTVSNGTGLAAGRCPFHRRHASAAHGPWSQPNCPCHTQHYSFSHLDSPLVSRTASRNAQ